MATLLSVVQSRAQRGNTDSNTKNTPYRPKIAEISFHNLYGYNTSSVSHEYGDANSEVERDKRFKVKLGVPIVMKQGKLIGLQLKYERQNFLFDFDTTPANYELYNHLENRFFTSLGARFLYKRSFDTNKEVTFLGGAELKSDNLEVNLNTTKFFASFFYRVNLDQNTKIGGGLVLGYTLRIPQVYPILNIEHKINPKLTLDASLPKSVSLRLKASDKMYVTAITELKGWRYAIHSSDLSPEQPLMLRKSDLQVGLSFERELHDWLWMGLDFGISENINYYLAETGTRRRDALINSDLNTTPFIKFGLFLVPPKKFYNR